MDIKKANKFLLHYRKKMYTPINSINASVPDNLIVQFLGEIANLGFTFDGEMIKALKTKDLRSIKFFIKDVMEILKENIGGYYSYEPLFKNFPNHVETNLEGILQRINNYVNQEESIENPILFNCGHLISRKIELQKNECPICSLVEIMNAEEKEKKPLTEYTSLKIIGYCDKEELNNVFVNLLKSGSLFSYTDKEFIDFMIEENQENIIELMPNSFSKKENLIYLISIFIERGFKTTRLVPLISTATDVLRLATFLSAKNTSISKNIKFKLSRKNRNLIVELLNKVSNPHDDIHRYKEKWKKLAHCIHIGEFKEKFPKAFKVITDIRNSKFKFRTFNSKLNTLISENNITEALNLLEKRPGDFLRRLDFLARTFDSSQVLESFTKVIPLISSLNLLTLRKFLESRLKKEDSRFFILKSTGKIKLLSGDSRKLLEKSFIDSLTNLINEELISRFSKEEKWESVFIDEEIKNLLLPSATQSSNKSLMNMTKGSKIRLEDKAFLRLFCYWKETLTSGTVDLDLCASGISSSFEKIHDVGYFNLRAGSAIHSGDFRSAPNGASEFIDIPVLKWREDGVKYIVMSLFSYSKQPFSNYNSSAGFMSLDEPWKGKVFEPKTVQNQFSIKNESKSCVPVIIDTESMEMYWVDSEAGSMNTLLNSTGSIQSILQTFIHLNKYKPNFYDLMLLHAKARAKTVLFELDEEQDVQLKIDQKICLNFDDILMNYLK